MKRNKREGDEKEDEEYKERQGEKYKERKTMRGTGRGVDEEERRRGEK